MRGIAGYGIYIPRYRIKREEIAKAWGGFGASGENSVPGIDEDIVTMAVEASDKAIDHAGVEPSKIGTVYFCTSSPEFIEKSSAAIVSDALGIPRESKTSDWDTSGNSSTKAISACLDEIEVQSGKFGLVITSDFRRASPAGPLELYFGAGAAAYVLGADNTIVDIEGMNSYTTTFTGTWKRSGDQYVKQADPRFSRLFGYTEHVHKAAEGLMKNLNRNIEDFNHVVFQQPDETLPFTLAARALAVKREQLVNGAIVQFVGDVGVSSVPIGLAAVLDKAENGEKILVVSYGSGASDAVSLLVNENIEKKRGKLVPVKTYLEAKEYLDYMRYLRFTGKIQTDYVS